MMYKGFMKLKLRIANIRFTDSSINRRNLVFSPHCMKKLRNIILGICVLLLLVWVFTDRYLNSGSMLPDNTVWESYIGRDTTVGILPDKYANYFTYTLARTNEDIGFKISGEFPDTRYFSFNVYSLGDNVTQGSLVDYQISTVSGRPNPFVANADSVVVDNQFNVHIIPSIHKDIDLPNVLPFRDDVKLLTMVIRLYDYNVDDFGGVDFPTVEAFSISRDNAEVSFEPQRLPRALNLRSIVRRVSLPKMVERLGLLYKTEHKYGLDKPEEPSQSHTSIPFHAIDTRGFIENNDNRYLLAAITKQEDEIYYFKFKAPSYTTGPSDINQTEVRYWSFNLGNAATYNFNALKDEDAIIDEDGYVNIILASKNVEVQELTKRLNYNFLEWNMPWEKALILFRHMLANPTFEAQIDNVPPIKVETREFKKLEGQHYMGDYAPQGIRMKKSTFLTEYGDTFL